MDVPTLCRNAIGIAQPCKPDSVWFRPKSERGDNLSKALDFSRARAALPSISPRTNLELVERRGLAPSKNLAVSPPKSPSELTPTEVGVPQPFRVSASLFAPLLRPGVGAAVISRCCCPSIRQLADSGRVSGLSSPTLIGAIAQVA